MKPIKISFRKTFDDYGGLSDQVLDLNEFQGFQIDKDEFEAEWKK
ncbi:hypothetical protein [Aquimarina sp. RZ0]|nr:hypothetical protein [Aquimarina sp. RZ0]